jgi:hypothetical protein
VVSRPQNKKHTGSRMPGQAESVCPSSAGLLACWHKEAAACNQVKTSSLAAMPAQPNCHTCATFVQVTGTPRESCVSPRFRRSAEGLVPGELVCATSLQIGAGLQPQRCAVNSAASARSCS